MNIIMVTLFKMCVQFVCMQPVEGVWRNKAVGVPLMRYLRTIS